jgi:hypothetical protein
MKEKIICTIQTQSPLVILSLCLLGLPSRSRRPNFLKKGKQLQIFADVK